LTLDLSGAELRGITDCSEVTGLATKLANTNGVTGSPKRGVDKEDLLPRLRRVLETGRVTIQLLQAPNLDHHLCHLAAGRQLREEVEKNPLLRYRVALGREQARLRQLTDERVKLEGRILELDVDTAVRRIQVEFLEKAILDLEQQSREPAAGKPSNKSAGSVAGGEGNGMYKEPVAHHSFLVLHRPVGCIRRIF
jgi:hypothetical protein